GRREGRGRKPLCAVLLSNGAGEKGGATGGHFFTAAAACQMPTSGSSRCLRGDRRCCHRNTLGSVARFPKSGSGARASFTISVKVCVETTPSFPRPLLSV